MKRNRIVNTYSDILQNEKDNYSNITNIIVDGLEKEGINISPRTIQKYKKGTLIPNYQMAKEIAKILKISFTETELLEILSNSQKQREIEKSNVNRTINPDLINLDERPTLRKRIAIKYDQFTFLDESNVSKEYAIELIEQHVQENYGSDKYAFNRYIKDLIDKDMSYENQ